MNITRKFIGIHDVKVDGKNRITLPNKFRDVLKEIDAENSEHVIVTFWFDKSLAIFPPKSYDNFISFLESSSEFDENTRDLHRIFIEGATELSFDSQNRITLPQIYLEKTGISKDVFVTGDKDKMLVREAISWDKNLTSAISNLSDTAQKTLMSIKNRPLE